MKKSFLLIIIISISILSCKNNRETTNKFGEYSFNLLKSGTKAKEIYIMPKDSILTKDVTLIKWMRSLKDSTYFSSYIEKQEKEIRDWRKKALDLNIGKSNTEYLRTEIDSVRNLYNTSSKYLTVFFLIDKKEHFFTLYDVDSLKGKWVSYGINVPTNQQEIEKKVREEKEKESLKPFVPYGLFFTSCNWEYAYMSPKTFSNFFVTLKNSTQNDFKKIKYRVTIYNGRSWEKSEVFSRTFERNETIFANDVIRFEVLELRDFYTGVNLSDKNNFDWNAVIIDAKPKPGYEEFPY